jgi:polyhydroxyalkanoate synthesis regulator protein
MTHITLIKYANRKVYFKGWKQYVTSEHIAGFLIAGATVNIIEHKSGFDVTDDTLLYMIARATQTNRLSTANVLRRYQDKIRNTLDNVGLS